jgi:hypothetical protein
MLRFIVWMIIFFVAAKIVGLVIRSVRLMLKPNKDILNRGTAAPFRRSNSVEDIPYEEINDKQ